MSVTPLAGPHAVLGDLLVSAIDRREPCVLATLVERTGHAYRAPGAHLLVTATTVDGSMSAGCIEEEVAAHARELIDAGGRNGATVDVDTDGEGIEDLGSGCGAVLTVALELVDVEGPRAAAWRAWASALREGAPARRRIAVLDDLGVWTTAWELQTGGFRASADGSIVSKVAEEDGEAAASLDGLAWEVHARVRRTRDGWLETVPRPPRATIAGSGPDAVAVARTMARIGWRTRLLARNRHALHEAVETARTTGESTPDVVAVDARSVEAWLERGGVAPVDMRDGRASEPRLERQDVVLAASHDLELDPAVVAWAVARGVRYVGVVGSRRRVERVVTRARTIAEARRADLGDATGDAVDLDDRWGRVDGPAGLDLGARGPWELATSVAARWIADLRASSAPVWAIVPAAGGARRLGVSKALVHRDGTTLIARAADLAEVACDGTVVVVREGRSERDVAVTDAVVRQVGESAQVVQVGREVRGLRGSLAAGVAAAPKDARALVLLPDMPGVDEHHLWALRRAVVDGGSSVAGAVTEYPDGGFGAPAIVPIDVMLALRTGRTAYPEVEPTSKDDVGLRGPWTSRPDVVRVPLRDARDLDDPGAVARAGWSIDGVPSTTA